MTASSRNRVLSVAVAAGIAVPFAFAWIVYVWGVSTLAWPGFRLLLMFAYPFATVPARSSLYPLFAVTAALNGAYYACVALIAIYARKRGASTFIVALVVLLAAIVAGSVLHLAFVDFGAIRMR